MEYSEQYIRDFLKDLDPFSLLVIHGNKLQKITCPFRVRLLADVTGWKKGDEKWVEKILITRDLKDVYLIGGNGYYFNLFQILLP